MSIIVCMHQEDDYTYTEDCSDEGDSVLIETDGYYEEGFGILSYLAQTHHVVNHSLGV